MHWISEIVAKLLSSWGYWAVLAGLWGEDAGLPVPGETVLVAASFLANKGKLSLYIIILVGVAAATTGDNTGFLIGRKFKQPFIRWLQRWTPVDEEDVRAARDLIQRRGKATIFIARFIFGLRTIAGLLAGALEMDWKTFFLYNFLGAVTWVTIISFTGYAFGAAISSFEQYFEYVSWSIGIVLFLIGYYLWRRHKKAFRRRMAHEPGSA